MTLYKYAFCCTFFYWLIQRLISRNKAAVKWYPVKVWGLESEIEEAAHLMEIKTNWTAPTSRGSGSRTGTCVYLKQIKINLCRTGSLCHLRKPSRQSWLSGSAVISCHHWQTQHPNSVSNPDPAVNNTVQAGMAEVKVSGQIRTKKVRRR